MESHEHPWNTGKVAKILGALVVSFIMIGISMTPVLDKGLQQAS